MSHRIVHVELSAADVDALAGFYETVFGWQIQKFPEMDYTSFSSGEGGPDGGFLRTSDTNAAGTTVIYIETDDVEASLAKIEAHGGKALMKPATIPGVGIYAHCIDPSGNRLALLKGEEGAM